ncbi:hypothetical protein HPB51_020425 [Rhipicephalus microplus]|uniref:BRK domain-containing protein n=1 Tax=Rhipicephalus microplus TaxID=6941 RepID=A0A9J6DX30_RHIMP|nr:hypothetical protein HPB51_020425 [Rhipicephalus microplus]
MELELQVMCTKADSRLQELASTAASKRKFSFLGNDAPAGVAPPEPSGEAPPAPKAVVRECLVCKRKAECIGLYCGRDCIAKYVHDASQTIKAAKLDGERRLMFTERSSGKLVAGVQVPTPENLTNWLVRNPTFELAVARTPGRPHSAKQPSSKAAQAKQPHSKSVKQPPAAQVQSAAPSGANTTTAAAPTPSSTTNSAPAESTSSGTEAVAGKRQSAVLEVEFFLNMWNR